MRPVFLFLAFGGVLVLIVSVHKMVKTKERAYLKTTKSHVSDKAQVAALESPLNFMADIEDLSANGFTTFMHSLSKGHTAVVQTLIDHGTDIIIRSSEGQTALDMVCKVNIREVINELRTVASPGRRKI